MRTAEFTKTVKRERLRLSGGKCEAEGSWYGHKPGVRCNANLAYGVRFDHIDPEANSKNNSLENCGAVCVRCHDYKTTKRDIPMIAKTVRQRDKHNGIRRKGPKLRSRGFAAFVPNIKQIYEEFDHDT